MIDDRALEVHQAVLYVLAFDDLDLHLSLWKADRWPVTFEFPRIQTDQGPKELPTNTLLELNRLVGAGVEKDILNAALIVLASQAEELRLADVRKCVADIGLLRNKALQSVRRICDGRLGQENRDLAKMGTDLVARTEAFIQRADGWLKATQEVDADMGRSDYFHQRAILALGDHLKQKLGRVPWRVIADAAAYLKQETDATDPITPDSLKVRYSKLCRDRERGKIL